MDEHTVLRKLIRLALSESNTISVEDGGDWPVNHSRDPKEIFDAATAVDTSTLLIRDSTGHKLGFVILVFGNAEDGSELVADYSLNGYTNNLVRQLEG